MKNRILWIDDDYYAIKGLLWPLEKNGMQIDVALCAIEAFHKAVNWQNYDLIILDLIIPLASDDESLPGLVKNWALEKHIGVGLAKWVSADLKIKIPILLLSVISEPLTIFNLSNYGLSFHLPKIGLLPTALTKEIMQLLDKKIE